MKTGLFPCLVLGLFYCACVPSGSAPPYDAGPAPTASVPTFRPSVNVMTAVFEDTFDRPDSGPEEAGASGLLPTLDAAVASRDGGASSEAGATGAGTEGGAGDGGPFALKEEAAAPFADNLGPNWKQVKTNAWKIENGK